MKNTLKKLLSLSLACAMLLSMGVTAFASESYATAYVEHEDGTIENLPVSYNIEMLPSTFTRNGVEHKYMVEASARATEKQEDGSKEKDGVTAILRVYWTDNSGLNNELTALTGGWTEYGGTVTHGRRVTAKSGGVTPDRIDNYPDTNAFGYYDLGLVATQVIGRTEAWIKTSAGAKTNIVLEVKPLA